MIKKSGKKSWDGFYFLALLPLFFVFHGYAENFPLAPLTACLLLLLKYLASTALISGLAFFILRNWRLSVMYAFLIIAFQIFIGPLHDGLKSLMPHSFLVKYVFLIPFFFVLFASLLIYFRKKKPTFSYLPRYLNILLLVFILIDVFQLVKKIVREPEKTRLAAGLVACDSCSMPDIYLFIADGYAGKKELKDIFHFDNSAFENELRKRGFFIIDSTVSNYNYTPFSMAAMFSMNYLYQLEGRNKSLHDRDLCYRIINNNELVGFLKYHGYDFKNCSIFQFAGKLPYMSTVYYKTGIDLVTAQTFLSRVDRDISFNLVTRFKIRSVTQKVLHSEFDINEELYKRTWEEVLAPSGKPRFVYTHLEMPHYPYYFDSSGKPNPMEDLWDIEQSDLKKYRGYLQYANKKIIVMLDHILKNSKKPPIVIFMSDHGFREFANDSVDHSYHFMNFNSIHLPGKEYGGFYKGMSTVNQFRVLLNATFNQQLPLIKDSTSFLKE